MKISIKNILCLLFIGIFCIILIFYILSEIFFISTKFKKINVGQTEEYILKYLGKPDKILEHIDVGDDSYKYPGFDRFKFTKSGKILIFSDKCEVLYILIINGKVEQFSLQGS